MNDNISNSICEFEKAWTKSNPGKLPGYCHNIYHLVSEDMDGNVTGEAFGINCMTDYGVTRMFKNYNGGSSSLNLYIGSGTSIPDPASQSMESLITSTVATRTYYDDITVVDNRYYQDIDMNVITGKIFEGYYDYTTLNSIGDAVEINEIGLGYDSPTGLYYHARVYDSSGVPSSIIKRKNEKLTITVYIRHLRPMGQIINKLWNKGVYMLSRVGVIPKHANSYNIFNTQIFYESCHITFMWKTYTADYDSNLTKTFQNNIFTAAQSTEYAGSAFMDDKHAYIQQIYNSYDNSNSSRYDDKYYAHQNARWIFFPKQPSPELIESIQLRTNSYGTNHISKVFGYDVKSNHDEWRWTKWLHGQIPVVDIDVSGNDTGIWMYNCQTDDWDIAETHNNPTTTEFGGVLDYLIHKITDYGYIAANDTIDNFQVWINPFTNVPITKITGANGGQGFRLYATDTYWDTSSWVLIPNLNEISQTLGTKRFYCVIGSDNISDYTSDFRYGHYYYTLTVTRTYDILRITTIEPRKIVQYGYGRFAYEETGRGVRGKIVTNDTYGYIAGDGWLVYPDTDDPNPILETDPYTYIYSEADTDNRQNGTYWYRYPLNGISNQWCNKCFIWNTYVGDKVIVMGNETWKQGYRVYTVNSDPTIAPTYEDCTFTTAWTNSNPHFSASSNGFFATSYISGNVNVNTTYILDVYSGANNDECEIKTLTGYHHCHIIDLTNYIACVNAGVSDHVQIDIIDMKTLQVYKTVDLDPTATFSGFAGFGDFLYIRYIQSNVTSMMLFVISSGVTQSLNWDNKQIEINADSYRYHIQRAVPAVDNMESCMIIAGSDISGRDGINHMLFKASDPANPIYLFDSNKVQNSYLYGNERTSTMCSNIKNQSCQLKYCNNNKQLLFAYATDRSIVIDVGYVINHGQHEFWPYGNYHYNDSDFNCYSICLYKNRVGIINLYQRYMNDYYNYENYIELDPIEFYINHKIGLYTRTIQAHNNPVQIGGISGIKYQYTNKPQIPLNT